MKDLIPVQKSSFIVGLLAALVGVGLASTILVEKLLLAADPSHHTSCSFNPIISCTDVMASPQASVFWGFPNPVLGVAGFSVLAMLMFLALVVKLPRWVWVVVSVGLLGALIFCFWLATQALFVIQAICVYCVGVWLVTSVLMWVVGRTLTINTRFEDYKFVLHLSLGAVLLAFMLMMFFAFSEYWLSFL